MITSWNVAFDMVMEIKHLYEEVIGKKCEYVGDNYLQSWVDALSETDNPRVHIFKGVLDELFVNQYGDYVLLHYKIPHDINGLDYFEAYEGALSECRSLVIDLRHESIVLAPFKKFRNIGECDSLSEKAILARLEKATTIEFSEKLDGSMQSARMVDGTLVMSGSKALAREQSYRLDGGYRYIETHVNYKMMLSENPELTFIFESIFSNDPHVVEYNEEGLYLVGIRDIRNGREFDYREVINIAGRYSVLTTTMYDFTLPEAMDYLKSVSGKEHEGFVMNIDGFRVKMKADDYIKINNWIFGLKDDNILLKTVLSEQMDDIIAKLPSPFKEDVKERTDRIISAIDKRREKVANYMNQINELGFVEKKDVMIWISNNVPRPFDAMVRCRYLKQNVDFTKNLTMEEVMLSE